jgi:protein gp37
MIFVCSMGDLFHEDVPDNYINWVFTVMTNPMSGANHHTYLILTKRPERILKGYTEHFKDWPNVWLGVTAENRPMWYERVPILKQIEAAKRFVSYEPALGPLGEVNLTNIDWVICGSESGPKRRPAKVEWIRDLKDQCVDAGVPFFLKQIEINKEIVKMPELDGQIWNEYPEANS